MSVLTLCQLDDLSDGIGLLDLRKRLNELIRTEPAGTGNFPVTGVGVRELHPPKDGSIGLHSPHFS